MYHESPALHAADLEHNRRRLERPPMPPYAIRRTGDIGPGTLFGTVGNYGNPESGYTVVNKNEVREKSRRWRRWCYPPAGRVTSLLIVKNCTFLPHCTDHLTLNFTLSNSHVYSIIKFSVYGRES